MLQLDIRNRFKKAFVPINLDANALAPVTLDIQVANAVLTDKVIKAQFVESNTVVDNLTVLEGVIKLPVQNTSLVYGINTVQIYIGTEKAPLININADSKTGHYVREEPITADAVQAAIDAIPAPEIPEAVKPDWNAAGGSAAEILNKPEIPAVTKPDWNAASGTAAEIVNKPTLFMPHTLGLLVEDFEDLAYVIPFTGAGSRVSDVKYAGSWSWKQVDGYMYTGSPVETIYTLNVPVSGALEFWYKRDNELNGFGDTSFILDNVTIESFSATRNWTKFSTPLAAGVHTFKIRQAISQAGGWWTKFWVDNMSIPSTRIDYPDTPDMFPNPGKLVTVRQDSHGYEYKAIPTGGISFFVPGDASVGQNKVGFVCPCAMTIVKCIAKVTTAPTGASLIADVHKNGTTIFTTQANRPTIAAAGTSVTTVAPDVTTLAEGDLVTLDIDQIGSTIAGANLAIVVEVLPVLS